MTPGLNSVLEFLKDAHKHCSNNKAEIELSGICGCFYCLEMFDPSEINEWVNDGSAICPRCGIDAVIGVESGYSIDTTFLNLMSMYWFDDGPVDLEIDGYA